jgi:5-methylcytosine-specific restriction endonuclease McrA
MERLCYDPNNCVLLCIPCHVRVHKELMSKTKAKVKERRQQSFERWKDRLSMKSGDQSQSSKENTK